MAAAAIPSNGLHLLTCSIRNPLLPDPLLAESNSSQSSIAAGEIVLRYRFRLCGRQSRKSWEPRTTADGSTSFVTTSLPSASHSEPIPSLTESAPKIFVLCTKYLRRVLEICPYIFQAFSSIMGRGLLKIWRSVVLSSVVRKRLGATKEFYGPL